MWIRNLLFFILDPEFNLKGLESALEKYPSAKPGGLEWFQEGFVAPSQWTDQLAPRYDGKHIVKLRRYDRVLPGNVIKKAVDDKVAEIEARELRKVGRKEKLALKEQITDDMLPRAFIKESNLAAWLDKKYICVDATSHNKAEGLVSKLREALPPFPAALARTVTTARSAMTSWLRDGNAPGRFMLDSDCVLNDTTDSSGTQITFKRADLVSEEIINHLNTGKEVTSLGLIWDEKIRFILTDTMQIKRIQFLDVLQEEANQAGANGGDASALFEATFTLVSEEMHQLINELLESLGGLEKADEA